jgi:hypothetical protein
MDEYFAIVPASVRYDKTLSTLDRNVYIEIAAMGNGKKDCWPSNRTIGDMLGVHRNTVGASINKLSRLGHISIYHHGTQRHIVLPINPKVEGINPKVEGYQSYDVGGINPTIEQKKKEDKKNKIRRTHTVFVVPSLEELKAYGKEIEYPTFDAGQFIDYYEAKGWLVGNVKMKDWRATVRNWKRRDEANPKPQNHAQIMKRIIDGL